MRKLIYVVILAALFSLLLVAMAVCFPALAFATVAREINGTASGSGASTDPVVVSLGSGISNNDLVFVQINTTSGQTSPTVPSGYTLISDTSYSSGNFFHWLYDHVWKTGDATSGLSFTFGGTPNFTWQTAAYNGEDTTPTLVTGSWNTANGTNPTATSLSITPTTSTDMLTMWYSCSANCTACASPSVGSINTQASHADNTCLADSLLSSGSATGNQTISLTTGFINWSAIQISIKPLAVPTPNCQPGEGYIPGIKAFVTCLRATPMPTPGPGVYNEALR